MTDRVVMGWCHGPVEPEFAASKENFFNYQAEQFTLNPQYKPWFCEGQIEITGLYVHENRNKIRHSFLERKADYLWMVDSDIMLDADSLDKLMALAHPSRIVAGRYRTNMGGVILPVWMTWNAKDNTYEFKKEFDEVSEPFLIDACGMGHTLIPREILEALPKHPFDFIRKRGLMYGEDVAFCYRAQKAGFEVWADPRASVRHIKKVAL